MNVVVVMGASGTGKTTLGRALAETLGWRFIEGDELHPARNVEKMRAGTPLDDDDRASWLADIARTIRAHRDAGLVITCSALKRRYRDQVRAEAGPVCFVSPVIDAAVLHRRVQQRRGHYMPASLVSSQLADFQPLEADERGVEVPGDAPVQWQVARVLSALQPAG
jgi:carbohydrate kinase (thermoresistant glucokinase family)